MAKKKALKKEAELNERSEQSDNVIVSQQGLTQRQVYFLIFVVILVLVGVLWYVFTTPVSMPQSDNTLVVATPAPSTALAILTIINDPSCDVCNRTNLREVVKTVFSDVDVIEVNATNVQDLISSLGIKALPAYVFSSGITRAENYTKIADTLREVNGYYVLNERSLPNVPFRYLNAPSTENEPATSDTGLTIIEFSDPACSACAYFNTNVKKMLEDEYGDKIRIVFKSMPISEATLPAAIAMECAFEQDKFWEYADLVYTRGVNNLISYAEELGLDMVSFALCNSSSYVVDEIMEDRAEGIEYGVSGTPTLFINGIKITGVPKNETLKAIIEAELA